MPHPHLNFANTYPWIRGRLVLRWNDPFMLLRQTIKPGAMLVAGALACAEAPEGELGGALPEVKCDSCGIQLEVARVLDEPLPEYPFLRSTRLTSRHGREIVAAPVGDRASLALIDADAFGPGIVLGRKGEGPGEFTNITFAFRAHDSRLVVLENGRLTLLDSVGSYLASTVVGPGSFEAIEVGNSSIVVNRIGSSVHPFVRLGPHLANPESFGPISPTREGNEYRMAASPGGSLWVARAVRDHILLHYDPAGVLRDSVALAASWHEAIEGRPVMARNRARARINGIQLLADGRILIVTLVADVRTEPPAKADEHIESSRAEPPRPHEYPELYDTLIHLIDASTGETLHSRVYDGAIFGLLGEGMAFEYVASEGDMEFAIRILRIVPPPHTGEKE